MASNLNRFMIHATELCNVVCSASRFYRSIEEVIGYFIIIDTPGLVMTFQWLSPVA